MKTYEYWLKYYENATKEQVIEDSMHDIEEITNLQQEIKKLKEQLANDIDKYEGTISYQLGFEKGKEEIKKEILEFVNNLNGGDKQEFMGYGGYELLEILGDKE